MLVLGFALAGSWCPSARADGGPGSLLAWGYNREGELGNGTTTDSGMPVPVAVGAIPPGTRITQVAAGYSHSLALSSTGQLYAWGLNGNGELGNGTTTNSAVPVAVSTGAIPPGTRIAQIGAGYEDNIALSSTGQLYAWGRNGEGQLGNGTATDSALPVAVSAGAIPPGTRIAQVAVGYSHSLALSSTGQLYAWGYNSAGQLGNGTTTTSATPVAVSAGAIPLGTRITQIVAGYEHSLALSSAGQLYAWGYNNHGQLGNATTTNIALPVAVSAGAIPVRARITRIAAGYDHSLALDASGQPYAWGRDGNGELGINSTSDASVPSRVSLSGIPSDVTITQIAAGSEHSLALSSTGQLIAWGRDTEGQLGDGSTTDESVPEIVTLSTGVRFATVASGSTASHTLAIVRDAGGAVLSGLQISPPAFRAALAGPSATSLGEQRKRRLVGAKISYTLSRSATVHFTVKHSVPGRVQILGGHARCVAQTNRNRRAGRCTRLVTLAGSFTHGSGAGASSLRFTGRLAAHALKPGRYVLVATPSAGGISGAPRTVPFRIRG